MRRKWMFGITLSCTAFLLMGCGMQKNVTKNDDMEPEIPLDVIYPELEHGNKDVKSREIELTDFTVEIPEGYTFGKKEQEDYTSYYVWKDEKGKEYSCESDGDIMLYLYDGVDKKSLHEEITDNEARESFMNTYFSYIRNTVQGKFNVDPAVTYSADGKYFICCFDGYSGDYITTTYSAMCYPKTYYGIFTLQKNTSTFDRQFYGFVFSNNENGEILKENEYNYFLDKIKSQFDITEFYSVPQNPLNYDELKDISSGRNYAQMRSLFENTYLYYGERNGKSDELHKKEEQDTQVQETAPTHAPEQRVGTTDD